MLQWVFDLLYGPLAPWYDSISEFFFAGQWHAWRNSALGFIKGPDVLEIGFGTGHLLIAMLEQDLRPTGIDPSRSMRLIARRNLEQRGLPDVTVLSGAGHLPFPDNLFDDVVATFPSSYILQASPWREVRRVLRPGGSFVVVLSGVLYPTSHQTRLLIRFHELVYGSMIQEPSLPNELFDGFCVRREVWENTHGAAYLLVARKV